ncbi:MAG: glycosyltransferase [Candidatus Omnitrophica bacterium]|nr:glycosyltransferase [Candidatus Omnitrophota bacterium]MDD5591850.1 glycosyltransferase [Candidatus Omnitrophota bacterium]
MNKLIVKEYFNKIAPSYDKHRKRYAYYHRTIQRFYSSIIPQGKGILEIGCATGDLLSALMPTRGFGIDISEEMICLAKEKHAELMFQVADISGLRGCDKFDYIVLSNLLDYSDDIIDLFSTLKLYLKPDSKIIITTVNPLWQPIIKLLEILRLKESDKIRNFVTNRDVINMLNLLDYDIIEAGYRLLLPFYIPFFSYLANKIFSRVPGINNLCSLQFIVAKPKIAYKDLSCSIVVPCFNEVENIKECIESIPRLVPNTEIIVVDDGSTDGTAKVVEQLKRSSGHTIKLLSYKPNQGKGIALERGFKECGGDVIIILDADMSVSPVELHRFIEPITRGRAEFINGTRMVYPIEEGAMSFLRFIGNKIFGIILSIMIGQRNTDVLCGTKSLLRSYIPYIKMGRCKWGDFDLLFGASKLKMKIIEMPIHYKARIAGKSKMKLFKDTLYFLKASWRGFNDLD